MNENLLDTGTYAYRFCKDDMLIRSCFSKNVTTKILKLLHSRYTQLFIILTILIFLILRLLTEFVFDTNHSLYHIYIIYVLSTCCFIWIPIEILWILTVNRIGLKLLLKSFVFWLKLIASLCFGITHFIYTYLTYNNSLISISYAIFNILVIPLVVLWISMFDAINVSKIWKIIFLGILGSIFLFFSINYEFLISQKEDYFVHLPIINHSISFFSVMASSQRLLCIFSFKQFFLTYYYTNKCVTIRYTPHLIWYKTENIDNSIVLYTINLDENIENIENEESVNSQSLLKGNVYAYKFNENDIYLFQWFGGKISKNILKFLHNPCNQFLTALTMLVFLILRILADFIFTTNHLIYLIYAIYLTSICYLVWFPLEITWIAICNRSAFKLLLRSFEFWLKFAMSYFYAITNLIYNYQIHDNALNNIDLVCYSVFNLICIPFAVVCVSILDCIPVNKIWKMAFSGIIGSIFLFFSIHYEFSISTGDDYIVSIPYIKNRLISFCSVQASAGRILAIFFFKQLFLTYRYHHDKCILIRYTPHLIWHSNQNICDSLELHTVNLHDTGIQSDVNSNSWEIFSQQLSTELTVDKTVDST